MMKKVIDYLQKWFGKKSGQVVEISMEEALVKSEKTPKKSSLLEDLEGYLFSRYDFRFNVLAEQTEFSEKGIADFRLVDQRVLNTLCMKARKEGINCWDKDVSRLLLSQQIADFHPFQDYVEKLPEWD